MERLALNRPGFYALALLVLLLDQLTKRWAAQAFRPGEGRDLLPGFFSLTLVQNTGGAFGILPSGTLGLAAIALLAAAAIVVFTVRARMPMPRLLAFGTALPLGGALGNLIDRVRLRYVVDFLDLHVGAHQWPVFNIADSAICVGVVLLALYSWRQPARQTRSALAPAKEDQ